MLTRIKEGLLKMLGFPFHDSSFRVMLSNEFYSNYHIISILTSHSEDITDEDREFLKEMKAKYQWGKYEVSHLYKHSSEKLKTEYRSLHRNICHLLYD